MANNVLVVQQAGPGGPFMAYDITGGFQAAGGTIDAALQAVVRSQGGIASAKIPAIYTAIFGALTTEYSIGATEYIPGGVAIKVRIFGGPLT